MLRWLKAWTSIPTANEIGGNVGLQIGEAQDEVRLEVNDAPDLRAGERGDPRLLLARPCGPHGKARNTDDPPVLLEQVQGLGRLLCQADDALREPGG